MTCKCRLLDVLRGDEAKVYACEHLTPLEVRADGWETVFRCPTTGLLWLQDWPSGEEHGGGLRRLARMCS